MARDPLALEALDAVREAVKRGQPLFVNGGLPGAATGGLANALREYGAYDPQNNPGGIL